MNSDSSPLLNREISWLAFNERVMEQATDPTVPLLDRLLFLTIAASNLDEFFMVRVGGLKLIQAAGIADPDPSALAPAAQLQCMHERVRSLLTNLVRIYRESLVPALAAEGIQQTAIDNLRPSQFQALESFFLNRIFPVITPTALRPGNPHPLLDNLALCLLVVLAPEKGKRTPRFAIIPIPRQLSRFVPVTDADPGNTVFVLIEDAIAAFASTCFTGIDIRECVPFRTTRNADIHVDETYAQDLARAMHRVLRQRKTSGCVRLEISATASQTATTFLQKLLSVGTEDTFLMDAPLQLNDFQAFYQHDAYKRLRYENWPPRQPADIDPARPMFEQITAQDLLLSLPFETFDPFIRFMEEAAADPNVLAIKMVLYRSGKNSPVVEALAKAAASGKSVTVLVELKARFDEENNIAWAERLERSGVQVIYGIKGLKTHAKICMVVRQEAEGIVRYVHIGTGNYNVKTARLYTDVSIFSRNDELGIDASSFFNTVCGYSEPQNYLKFVQAPIDLQQRIVELIDFETAQQAQGRKSQILAKMNALVDPTVIAALYRASQAGVDIQLVVRGTCCLRPGVPGLSETIRVVSIIDRFLEHSRIFFFHHGGGKQLFIASADWMPRNLIRRIELMVPIENRNAHKRLLRILKVCLSDNTNAWLMQPDGTYRRMSETASTGKRIRAQEILYQEATLAATQSKAARRIKFEPHLPEQSESS